MTQPQPRLRPVDTASSEVVRAWTRAYQLAEAELRKAAYAAAEAGATGTAILRSARSRAALDTVRQLMVRAGVVSRGATDPTALAIGDQAIERTSSWFAGSTAVFIEPNAKAIQAIQDRTQQRITSRYRALTTEADRAVRDALRVAVTQGQSPFDAARRMTELTQGVFGGGVARAVTIARTELIDADRKATDLTFQENADSIRGWRWLATLSPRTCPACWAMHNSIHRVGEPQNGHPNCRCTQVPVLIDDDAHGDLGSPEAVFRKLPQSTQLEIMGPSRLRALDDGLSFRNLASLRENPDWRPSIQVTPVADLGKVWGPKDRLLDPIP